MKRPLLSVIIILYFAVIGMLYHVKADVFDSVANLRALVQHEDWLVEKVREYLANEEERLRTIKHQLKKISAWSAKKETLDPVQWNQYITELVEHPVNAFNLIKDWRELTNLASKGEDHFSAVRSAAVEKGITVPDESDYRGAILGLARLQKTYSLPTGELAKGRIYNASALQEMAKSDFLEMAKVFMNIDHSAAMSWYEEYLRAGIPEPEQAKEIYLNMMNIYKQAEDYERAWITAHKAIQKGADNTQLQKEMIQFQRNIEVQKKSGTYGDQKYYWKNFKDRSLENYEALCRGENMKNNIMVNKNLICVYRKGILPYVQYKEEIHSFSPRISLFIDVITDEQAEMLKEKAFPSLFRAQVGDPTLNLTSDERISKLSWLFDFDPEVQKISQKVADITGLSTTYKNENSDAEAFQVVSYGIGGQYEPHYDYYDEEMLKKLPPNLIGTGDRISTFMFYLTHPIAGGATVFPQVGVHVPPIKNAAAFWYNFNLAGDRDTNTLHAGCPLLLGQKWVSNKWIRQGGQTFRRRCSLDRFAQDPIWYS